MKQINSFLSLAQETILHLFIESVNSTLSQKGYCTGTRCGTFSRLH